MKTRLEATNGEGSKNRRKGLYVGVGMVRVREINRILAKRV